MSLLLLWNGGVAVTPPAPAIVVVGGRPRRLPYHPKRHRVEAVVRSLAEDLVWEPPIPQFAKDDEFLELLLMDAL